MGGNISAMGEKRFDRDKSILLELVRFGVIGVYATIIDMAAEGWLTSLVSSKTQGASSVAAFFAMFVISVFGFIIATPASWSLTSIWGFRNVSDESKAKTRSVKGLLLFTFWSFVALLLGALIQFLCYMFFKEWSSLGIDILGGFNFESMFVEGHMDVFFAWFGMFVVRTAVTMVFNYLTRKFFLYKAPKSES